MGMDVSVKHNGADVTDFVSNYTREQKICSGIGTLEISFVNTVNRDFDAFDTIELYEGGNKKGIYYISVSSESEPDGMVTLACQDGSKKLMDYFISTSYLIDYPSYSRTWIEQFLTEAQVDFSFTTDSVGGLLSNNTSLGMSSAYDQIIPLLQMNGWYIYFNSDNIAIIGKLKKDVLNISETLNKRDILEINTVKNDKMLRNRVVVWGTSDPTTSSWVFADLSTHTKWNYDNNDYRTAVISNSNIPNVSTATIIANEALTEFANITLEKHLSCYGARNVGIGDFIFVKSDVYRGIGLVTTIGSTLSSEGFKTNIILDERCPRLFSYFDFGDYVYVSTMGSGVWRKHLEFDPTWYPYSSGLVDPRVTDLYKNNGILSAVTASGQAYYNLDIEGYWKPIIISGLITVTSPTGADVEVTGIYSGAITARAVIHDKLSNNIRIATSTNLADNYTDYSTGISILTSGVSIARSWIVDYNPATELIENSYPINISGAYDVLALDIENDGSFDYVTISTSGAFSAEVNNQFVFGKNDGQQWQDSGKVSFSALDVITPNYEISEPPNNSTMQMRGYTTLCTYDTYGVRGVVGCHNYAGISYVFGNFLDYESGSFTESYLVQLPISILQWLAIYQESKYVYTLFCKVGSFTSNVYRFYVIDLLANTCVENSSFTIDKTDAEADSFYASFTTEKNRDDPDYLVARSGSIVYGSKVEQFGKDLNNNQTNSKLYGLTVNLQSKTFSESLLLDCEGTLDSPNYLTRAFTTSFGDSGCLLKVGRVKLELNAFHKISNVVVKIINFYNDSFTMHEQEEILADVVTNYYLPKNISQVLLLGVTNTFVSSVQLLSDSGYFGNPKTIIESIYPIKESYNIAHTTGNLIKNYSYFYFSQTGNTLRNSYFGYISPTRFGLFDVDTKNLLTQFIVPTGHTGKVFCPHLDSVTNNVYIYGKNTASGLMELLEFSNTGDFIRAITLTESFPAGITISNAINSESFIIAIGNQSILKILYLKAFEVSSINITLYELLKREGTTFTVLRTDPLNMRIDNSLSMPLISVDNILKTTSIHRNFIDEYTFKNVLSEGDLEESTVGDFRYTNTDVIPISGYGSVFTYTSYDGIHLVPIEDGLVLEQDSIIFTPGSGIANRIETSNFKLPSQYIFTTTSGNENSFSFFQAGPTTSGVFAEYNYGFPQVMPTRIRIDDRI